MQQSAKDVRLLIFGVMQHGGEMKINLQQNSKDNQIVDIFTKTEMREKIRIDVWASCSIDMFEGDIAYDLHDGKAVECELSRV